MTDKNDYMEAEKRSRSQAKLWGRIATTAEMTALGLAGGLTALVIIVGLTPVMTKAGTYFGYTVIMLAVMTLLTALAKHEETKATRQADLMKRMAQLTPWRTTRPRLMK